MKNQGQCGSCWSFSTVANIETAAFAEKVGSTLYDLSEQQLVDCDKSENGCDGGLPEQADKWLIAHHSGLEMEKDYPYQGLAGKCMEQPSRERVFVGSFVHLPTDEDAIARGVMQYGALSIGINANQMQMYMGGIADPGDDACDPQQLNHGVALVGFGAEVTPRDPKAVKALTRAHEQYQALGLLQSVPELQPKMRDAKTPFWIIRNSWGPEWGEEGYYRIVRGKGACGMNQLVTGATDLKTHKEETNKATTPATAEESALRVDVYV